MTYRLSEAASVDLDNGRIQVAFAKGNHEPKDDAEREALEHLVTIGLAERAKAGTAGKED